MTGLNVVNVIAFEIGTASARVRGALLSMSLVIVMFAFASSAQAAVCPNEGLRIGAASRLPDCRAYEMVSPIDKNGGDIDTAEQEAGEGSHLGSAYRQASIQGGELTYSSATAFGDAVGGHWSNQYIATRGSGGWSTHSISSRRGRTVLEPTLGFLADLRWFTYGFVQGFTPDLSSAWVRDDNVNVLAPGALNGYANLYRRDNGADSYEPLTTQAPVGASIPSLSTQGQSNRGGLRAVGASSDLRHQVFVAGAALTPNAVQTPFESQPGVFEPGTVSQLYDFVDGELHLVSLLPNGQAATTFSFAGTSFNAKFVTTREQMLENAVSDDGSRVFWSATKRTVSNGLATVPVSGAGTLYVRENPGEEQSTLAHGAAGGNGDVTSGSPTVTSVTTTSGAFAVGQTIEGNGIPSGTTIIAVAPGSLTLSANATANGTQAPLESYSECTEPEKACTIPVVGSATNETAPVGQFWAASNDGTQLLYSVGGQPDRTLHLFDVDAGTSIKLAEQSAGVSATADDLSHIYFVSREDKAPGAVAGENNLYHYHEGDYTLVGIVSADDVAIVGQQFGGSGAFAANVVGGSLQGPVPVYAQTRATPDGRHFTFASNSNALSEETADYDNTDLVTGQPDFEVYHYDADAEQLSCVSCNPSGERPRGSLLRAPYSPLELTLTDFPNLRAAASIPPPEHDNYASRILSDDGRRLFFHSDEALLAKDTNGAQDVYQWQVPGSGSCEVGGADYVAQNNGCINLISSGRDGAKSEFVDADPTGEEVFFSTDASLDPRDPGLRDIYVAKTGGGFPLPSPPVACEGEACQSPPAPPSDPTPASATFQGLGDPKPGKAKPRCPKGKRRVKTRNGKVRCVAPKKQSDKPAKRTNTNRRAAR